MDGDRFWKDKCVIVTGASSGIGHGLAVYVGECGARVGLIARRRERLLRVAEEIRALGGIAEVAVANVDEPDAMRSAVNSLEARLGDCDVMIANAGIHRDSPGFDFNIENANAIITTNVGGVINALGAVLPGMVVVMALVNGNC